MISLYVMISMLSRSYCQSQMKITQVHFERKLAKLSEQSRARVSSSPKAIQCLDKWHMGHRDMEPWMGWKAACSDAEAGSWQQGILGVEAAGKMSVVGLGDSVLGGSLPRPGWGRVWQLGI